ncbi:Ger(x)C family spore germination C-terminal domain-containing protein [Clostridium massiliodielmoense]|uniref:Ger(x)C family spore germination C-terminal domain-containing protein n=1 Tax=Clostridium massiliodielmoense TaxID=1776385 RepID=UPI0004D44CD5|nr:Ger(x)C family spore germination C-terminal domain-containing protein [Clostridium massiliodielmoense]KEH97286.1 spore gernimation protein [Clostridium botulinum C/D str. BKT12695]
MKYSSLKKVYLVGILLIFIISYAIDVSEFVPIENLDIPIAIGYDFSTKSKKNPMYNVSIAVYQFLTGNQQLNTIVIDGKAESLAKTRENRQTKSNKKFILGSEKVLLINKEVAKKSISPVTNILFNNTYANDTARAAIFNGDTKDALSFKVRGYNSAADYIRGMIDSSINYNFFSSNYKMIDVYTRLEGEGRNIVLPYIEIKDGIFQMTGLGIFNKDKLGYIADSREAKIINLLRENNVSGIVHLQNKNGKNTNLDVLSRRKVTCDKQGDKYKFTINLTLDSEIIENEIYTNVINNPNVTKKIERNSEELVKKVGHRFIKKMQDDIKFDCLELGKVAAAKYGRRTGTDWNKVVCESNIEVNVKVNLKRLGRGMLK